jgi:hypothetical protein
MDPIADNGVKVCNVRLVLNDRPERNVRVLSGLVDFLNDIKCLISGGGGNRTRVRMCVDKGCYMFRTVIVPLALGAHGHAPRAAT